jgi:hypothetical protein
MTSIEKAELLKRAKQFFVERIAEPHLQRTRELGKLSKFKVNPFLDRYLARFYSGSETPRALAQTLLLPRVLGTSITGSFGTAMQKFCDDVLRQGQGNALPGIDLEFVDAIDGRKKYCQIKSGPETINNDDVETIARHFKSIKNRARTNSVKDLRLSDLCVGVLYGTSEDLSGMYRRIEDEHDIPVFVGKDFWHRLTGEPEFYSELIAAFADAAAETDATKLLEDVTKELAAAIAERNERDETAV